MMVLTVVKLCDNTMTAYPPQDGLEPTVFWLEGEYVANRKPNLLIKHNFGCCNMPPRLEISGRFLVESWNRNPGSTRYTGTWKSAGKAAVARDGVILEPGPDGWIIPLI